MVVTTNPKKGRQMSSFPLEPSYSRMLLGSVTEKCSDEMLTLISMLSVENLFFRPSQKKQQVRFCYHKLLYKIQPLFFPVLMFPGNF